MKRMIHGLTEVYIIVLACWVGWLLGFCLGIWIIGIILSSLLLGLAIGSLVVFLITEDDSEESTAP